MHFANTRTGHAPLIACRRTATSASPENQAQKETFFRFPRFPSLGETEGFSMKSVVLGVAVAATLVVTNPTSAQVVARNREDVIIRDHEHGGNRYRSWHRDHAECRTVRFRTQLPS